MSLPRPVLSKGVRVLVVNKPFKFGGRLRTRGTKFFVERESVPFRRVNLMYEQRLLETPEYYEEFYKTEIVEEEANENEENTSEETNEADAASDDAAEEHADSEEDDVAGSEEVTKEGSEEAKPETQLRGNGAEAATNKLIAELKEGKPLDEAVYDRLPKAQKKKIDKAVEEGK